MPETPSPKHGIVRPADGDFINSWPALLRAVVDWVDPNIATFSEVSPRPAAGISGRWHRNPPDGTLSFDTGAAWVEVPWGSIAALLSPGGGDPLTVTAAMLAADVPVLNVGDQVATARQTLPASGRFAWCDGSLIRADLYPEYMAAVGHAYNGGANPGVDAGGHQLVKLPSKAGRGSIGAGVGQGLSNRVRGSRFGVEAVTLTVAQIPKHGHRISNFVGGNVTPAVGVGGYRNGTNTGPLQGTDAATGVVSDAAEPSGAILQPGGGSHENMMPVETDNWMVRIV